MKNPIPNIHFTKMQGTGNDFIVINNLDRQFSKEELTEITPELCHRKFGIGSDGLLALFPPKDDEADYDMFYRNPDGSDAGMCGNGARCLALFARQTGFEKNHMFTVKNKRYNAEVSNTEKVCISFSVETSATEIKIDNRNVLQLHTGTEHIVTAIEQQRLTQEDFLRKEGKTLRYHANFEPKGTNVNFICGLDNSTVRLQTYERGVENLTLACGTGAIASALAWHHLQGKIPATQPFKIITEGGTLMVYFSFDNETEMYSNLKLEGPAHVVFEGTYHR